MKPITSSSPDREQVVVGAGYAGVLCANRLARKSRAAVVLVSEHATLLNRIRLHETAARGTPNALPLAPLLHPRVRFVEARAHALDTARRTLSLRTGERDHTLPYRTLVLALGSRIDAPFPCDAPHALALASHERALALHAALRAAAPGSTVNVVGGGLTGIELASEIAEAWPTLRVRLVCRELAPHVQGRARSYVLGALARLGVEVVEAVAVEKLDAQGVHGAHGALFAAEISVLAAGFRAAAPAWLAHLGRTPDGRIAVDHGLRVLGHDDVYAVGDLAAPPASTIGEGVSSTRMGCVSAMPLGAHAADVIAGGAARAFHFNYPGQNVSLGRRAAITLLTDRDDRPTGRFIDGRAGALIKEIVCRFVISALRFEAREWLGYAWLGMHSRPHSPQLRLAP